MKFKKILALSLIITFSLGAIAVNAEENDSTSTEGIKAKIERPFEKRDVRNPLLGQRREDKKEIEDIRDEEKNLRASTTDSIEQMRDDRREEINDIRASSTMMFKELKDQKRVEVKNLKLKEFVVRKSALSRELTQAIKNLENIDNRIKTRILNASSTDRDLTDAKAALITAESKLAAAKIAVTAFNSFTYASSTVRVGTTTEISLEKPRKIGDDAIKAVKDARDSFKVVVGLIAKDMGLGEDRNGDENKIATSTN